MTPTCKSCAHYKVEAESDFVPDFGACHRFPPQPVTDSEGNTEFQFPSVYETSTCGEWKPNQ